MYARRHSEQVSYLAPALVLPFPKRDSRVNLLSSVKFVDVQEQKVDKRWVQSERERARECIVVIVVVGTA